MASLWEGGNLLVPIANPDTVDRLIDTAISLARASSVAVTVLHVVEVPPQVPLSEGRRLVDPARRELVENAAERCEEAEVTATPKLRFSREVANGIVGAVGEDSIDALLMGWRGRPRRRDIILGSFLDRVMKEAPCDVLVKRITEQQSDINSILVPIAGGPHCGLSVRLAGIFGRERDASVQLIHVISSDSTEETRAAGADLLAEYTASLELEGVKTQQNLIQSDDVPEAVTRQSAQFDLTILGATRDPFLKRKLVGSVAEGVGRTAQSQVLLTRKYHREANS